MTLATLFRWGPLVAAIVLALGLAWTLDMKGDAEAALRTERETTAQLREDLGDAQQIAANFSNAVIIQSESARAWGARLESIDARLSSGLDIIANAPDSTNCSGSAALGASERVVRDLAEADARLRRSP